MESRGTGGRATARVALTFPAELYELFELYEFNGAKFGTFAV
jgi:hypothetical protein